MGKGERQRDRGRMYQYQYTVQIFTWCFSTVVFSAFWNSLNLWIIHFNNKKKSEICQGISKPKYPVIAVYCLPILSFFLPKIFYYSVYRGQIVSIANENRFKWGASFIVLGALANWNTSVSIAVSSQKCYFQMWDVVSKKLFCQPVIFLHWFPTLFKSHFNFTRINELCNWWLSVSSNSIFSLACNIFGM